MARKTPLPPSPVVQSLADFERVLDKALDVAVKNPDALPGMHESAGNPVTLAPRVPSAGDMVEKLMTNAQAAGECWLAGVKKPRKEPLKAALAALGKYKSKMAAALASGSWEKGLAAADETAMYATIDALGAGVFTTGVGARKAKMTAAFTKLQPMLVALANTIDAMPQDTEAQREARLLAARRGMIEIGKKLKGL